MLLLNMRVVTSNDLLVLLNALELNLDEMEGARPWVVFPHSAAKSFFYDALARLKRPRAIEPFYLDELLGLLAKGKRRASPEHKQWILEEALLDSGFGEELSPSLRERLLRKEARETGHLFGELEQYVPREPLLEERELVLWKALFKRDGLSPLYDIEVEPMEGITLHAFGFSFLPQSWLKILERLGATIYMMAPSAQHLSGPGLLGAWPQLKRRTLEGLEEISPLMLMPESLAKSPIYAPYVGLEMGLKRTESTTRLEHLKADLVTGRDTLEPLDLPVDDSVKIYESSDEPALIAHLVRSKIELGSEAREIALFCAPDVKAQDMAAALRREGIPFSLSGVTLLSENSLITAWFAALRLSQRGCRRADLELIARALFPELIDWLECVDQGESGPLSFRDELQKWLKSMLEEGMLFKNEKIGDALASLWAIVQESDSYLKLGKKNPKEWSTLFETFLDEHFALLSSDLKERVLKLMRPFQLDMSVEISFDSAVSYLEEALKTRSSALNLLSDAVRLSPFDHRFVSPAKHIFIAGLGDSFQEMKRICSEWIPSEKERMANTMLDCISAADSSFSLSYRETPTSIVLDLIDHFAHFPIEKKEMQKASQREAPWDFFTTWKELPAKLPSRSLIKPSLAQVRHALSDPINWFLKGQGAHEKEPFVHNGLIAEPLDRAIQARRVALNGSADKREDIFGSAVCHMIQEDVEIKKMSLEAFGLGRLSNVVLTPQVRGQIETEEAIFYPSTILEGHIQNVSSKGLVLFGRDLYKMRARALPDLLALAMLGRSSTLFMVDLDREESFHFRDPEKQLNALIEYTAIGQELLAPLLPRAVPPLLKEDAAAFSKALDWQGDTGPLMELWRPLAKQIYEGVYEAV